MSSSVGLLPFPSTDLVETSAEIEVVSSTLETCRHKDSRSSLSKEDGLLLKNSKYNINTRNKKQPFCIKHECF